MWCKLIKKQSFITHRISICIFVYPKLFHSDDSKASGWKLHTQTQILAALLWASLWTQTRILSTTHQNFAMQPPRVPLLFHFVVYIAHGISWGMRDLGQAFVLLPACPRLILRPVLPTEAAYSDQGACLYVSRDVLPVASLHTFRVCEPECGCFCCPCGTLQRRLGQHCDKGGLYVGMYVSPSVTRELHCMYAYMYVCMYVSASWAAMLCMYACIRKQPQNHDITLQTVLMTFINTLWLCMFVCMYVCICMCDPW